MIIADSDVLIDALAGRDPAAGRVSTEMGRGVLATSAITAFELLSGARTKRTADRVGRLLAALTILPVDEEAGRRAAEVRISLEARGTPIGMADYLIAGVCLARSAGLLSRYRAHFERIPGLLVDDAG